MTVTNDERREAVDACEERPDAPAAVDDEQTDTDAHADGNEASDGARATSMDVLRWVKDHGGLDAVRKSVEQIECRKKLLDCFAMRLGFETLEDAGDISNELEKRLMPEGMEWPRFEDGEPVRPGDELLDKDGDWFEAVSFVFTCDWWGIRGYQAEGFGDLNDKTRRTLEGMSYGARVKRPAPKVLDADGVEIRVGDTVYHVKDGSEMTVYGIEGEWLVVSVGGRVRHDIVTHRAPVIAADGKPLEVGQTAWSVEDGTEWCVTKVKDGKVFIAFEDFAAEECDPSLLTHQRPVLDADGVPIREGDTVYVLGFGEPLTVKDFTDDGRVLMSFHDENSLGYKPSKLTHERPESWERLEEDAGKNPFDYCKDVGHRLDTCENAERFKARDIVRRAKALAERERGE